MQGTGRVDGFFQQVERTLLLITVPDDIHFGALGQRSLEPNNRRIVFRNVNIVDAKMGQRDPVFVEKGRDFLLKRVGDFGQISVNLQDANVLARDVRSDNVFNLRETNSSEVLKERFLGKIRKRSYKFQEELFRIRNSDAELTERANRNKRLVFRVLQLNRRRRAPFNVQEKRLVDEPNFREKRRLFPEQKRKPERFQQKRDVLRVYRMSTRLENVANGAVVKEQNLLRFAND